MWLSPQARADHQQLAWLIENFRVPVLLTHSENTVVHVTSEHPFRKKCIFSNFILIVDTTTDVCISTLLCPPPPSPCSPFPLPGHRHCGHTVVCVYGLCMYVLWLIPSPSFIQPLSPTHKRDILPVTVFLESTLCDKSKQLPELLEWKGSHYIR